MNPTDSVWYLSGEGGRSMGPYSTERIVELMRNGQVAGTTLGWSEGMTDWRPLAEIEPIVQASRQEVLALAHEPARSPSPSGEPGATWYLPGEGAQPAGPYTATQIVQWLRIGELNQHTRCWREGLADWQPLGEIGELMEALREAQIAARRRWRRVAFIGGALTCLAAAVGGGWYWMMGPPEVRQGKDLVKAGLYAEASQVLTPFVQANPLDAQATYLLAVAKTNEYAAAEASMPWSDFGGRDDVLKEAAKLYQRALRAAVRVKDEAREAKWKEQARKDLMAAVGRVPPKVRDRTTRLLRLGQLQVDLQVIEPKSMARQLMSSAGVRGGSGALESSDEQLVLQILDWDPKLAGEIVTLILGGAGNSVSDLAITLQKLQDWSKTRADLAAALPDALLSHADGLMKMEKYNEAELLLSAPLVNSRTRSRSPIAEKRLMCLKKRLAGGDAAGVVSDLDRTYKESPEMQAGAASLYREAAFQLRASKKELARRALQKVLELEPAADRDEEVAFLELELIPQPDDARLAGLQAFLDRFPQSDHRVEVLLMVVGEVSRISQQGWGVSRERMEGSAKIAIEAAGNLLKVRPRPAGLEASLFGLAESLARLNLPEKAVELASLLREATPETLPKNKIIEAIAKWRAMNRPEKPGGVVPDPAPAPVRPSPPPEPPAPTTVTTPPELKAALGQLGQQRVLWVRLKEEQVSGEDKESLRQWVKKDGGVLWLDTDLARSFGLDEKLKETTRVDGTATGSSVAHALIRRITKDVAGEKIGYCLSSDRLVVTPPKAAAPKKEVALKTGYPKPLLVADDGLVCTIHEYQRGWVVYRPSQIDQRTDAGRRFTSTLASVSFELAEEARKKPAKTEPEKGSSKGKTPPKGRPTRPSIRG